MSPRRRTIKPRLIRDEVAAANTPAETNSSERPGRTKRPSAKKAAAPSVKATKASSGRRNPNSKQDQIVTLLRQPKGATLDVLVKTDRMAKALSAWLFGWDSAQEAETSPDFRKDRRYQDLSDRGVQSREGCQKTTIGVIRCPGENVMRPLWRPRSRACPISAMTSCANAGSCCSGVPHQNR